MASGQAPGRGQPDIASVAALVGEPARAAILTSLLGGVALPAGELARRTGVTTQTASAHLARLREGGLVTVQRFGRHRYYRLAGAEVGQAVEALATIAPRTRIRSLRESLGSEALCAARTCYDHLAGRLGVAMTDTLRQRGDLREDHPRDFALTKRGEARLSDLGVDIAGPAVLAATSRASASTGANAGPT